MFRSGAFFAISSEMDITLSIVDQSPTILEVEFGMSPPSSRSIIFWNVVVIPASLVVTAGVSTIHLKPVVEYNCCIPMVAANMPSLEEKTWASVAALGLSKSVSQDDTAKTVINSAIAFILKFRYFFIFVFLSLETNIYSKLIGFRDWNCSKIKSPYPVTLTCGTYFWVPSGIIVP